MINIASIVALVTVIITYLFGILNKKINLMEKKYIPIQNLIIGILSGIICYELKIDGMDLVTSVITCLISAMSAGGTYDLIKTKED